jgi:hypothetical protein
MEVKLNDVITMIGVIYGLRDNRVTRVITVKRVTRVIGLLG